MPILFCGINWHGPSCKNLAMPKDDASIDRQSFIRKIDMTVDPSSITIVFIRINNTKNWGKVSEKVSKKNLKGIMSIDINSLLLFFVC